VGVATEETSTVAQASLSSALPKEATGFSLSTRKSLAHLLCSLEVSCVFWECVACTLVSRAVLAGITKSSA
jgi:hypothetical protein